jgi:hypothetical protein
MTSILVLSLVGLALNLIGAGLAASSLVTQVRGRDVWPWWRVRLRKGKDLVRRIVTRGRTTRVYASYGNSWDTDAPLHVFVPGPPALRTRARLQQLEDKVTFLEEQLQSTHEKTADKIRRAKKASAEAVQNLSHRLDAAERATAELETKVLNRELFGLLLVAVGAVLQGVAGLMTLW